VTPREEAQRLLDAIEDDDLFRLISKLDPDPEVAVSLAIEKGLL